MFLLKLAVRNLFRNLRRSLLTTITIGIGILGFVMASGMVNGVEESFIRNDINTDTGHVRIVKKGYFKDEENFPLDFQMTDTDKMTKAILKTEPKAIVLPRIVFSVNLGDGVHSLRVRAIGVEPKTFEKMYGFSRRVTQKKGMPDSGNVMIVGYNLAKVFKKKRGDSMTIVTRTKAGSFNALDFQIFDLINSGSTQIDDFTVYLPLKSARTLLQMKTSFTDVIVRLPSRSKRSSNAIKKAVLAVSPSTHPQTWQEKAQDIIQLNSTRRKIFNFMITMILLIAGAGIANTILMSGFERKGEIGMMLAMGMPSRKIVNVFALEAAFLGLFGSLVGGLLGAAGSYYYQITGIELTSQTQVLDSSASSISYATTLYFEMYPSVVVTGILIGTLIATLAALYPAYKVTRLEPREILAGG